MLHSVTKIIEIKPFFIRAIFDGNEERIINFQPLIKNVPILKKESIFRQATLDDYPTIKWDNLGKIKELDGSISSCPLDFSPNTLYELSTPVSE